MKHLKLSLVLLLAITLITSCEEETIMTDTLTENNDLIFNSDVAKNFNLKNVQSELARIYLEEQKVLTKPVTERANLLSKLQSERKAILEELERIAFKNNVRQNTTNSTNLSSRSSLSTIHVGSVSDARYGSYGWTLDGSEMPTTLAKLTNLDNFGPSGTYSSQLSFTHVASTLDSATLANFDIFFIGYWEDGTFSSAELDALFNWVNSGGNIIITADDMYFDDVAESFGYPIVDYGTSDHDVVLNTHPFFNGPFGSITSFSGAGAYGYFSQGSATLLATNSNGEPSILETTIGDGLVVLLSDVDMLSTWGGNLSGGSSITTNNDILLGNLFAYIADGADTDNDGVPNSDDPFPNSNMDEMLSIGGYDFDIENQFSDEGTTMMDQIDALIAEINEQYDGRNGDALHRMFTRELSKITYYWYKSRLISRRERTQISRAASNMSIPFYNQEPG